MLVPFQVMETETRENMNIYDSNYEVSSVYQFHIGNIWEGFDERKSSSKSVGTGSRTN